MKTIWKQSFEINDKVLFKLPRHSEIVHVGLDSGGKPCLWFETDITEELRDYRMFIIGTGNPLPREVTSGSAEHFTTFVHGPFVWHVYL